MENKKQNLLFQEIPKSHLKNLILKSQSKKTVIMKKT